MLTNDSFETLSVSPAYPGHLLTTGSNSSEVARIQTYLNALRVDNPNISALTVDGKFGQNTKIAVQVFQYTHSLASDGIVGGATWNAIISAYNARFSGSADTYPGITLRPGARSQDVGHMQTRLNELSKLYTAISSQTADSAYGQNMSAAARLFQRQFGLAADGLVGKDTWAKVVEVHSAAQQGAPTRVSPAYAGTALRTGSSGDDVRIAQSYLNKALGAGLNVDGRFGASTRQAAEAFQAREGLSIDGVIGRATWDKLVLAFNAAL
ncbi:MAG: peptidoglycan-binding domain-containing protein [Ruthenibacterium sp.]